MKTESRDIFPDTDFSAMRKEKEAILKQKAVSVWLFGLSGSGKTTIAKDLEKRLIAESFFCRILDGDDVRSGINNNLGFSLDDRLENIRRIAEINTLFLNTGIIVINSFVCPTIQMRQMAKSIIGASDFVEVYVSTPLEVCEQRDVKGLYKKARANKTPDFTGISSPFEEPENPDLILDTSITALDECTKLIFNYLHAKIKFI